MTFLHASANYLSASLSRYVDLSNLKHESNAELAISVIQTVAIIAPLYFLVPFLHSLFLSPLRNVPGPFLARVTRWWEYRLVAKGDSNRQFIHLHNKYGSIVRVGPNRYSVSNPADVKVIYELGGKFAKTDFYKPLLSPARDDQNIFAIQDNELHKDRRRKISPLYTMSSMVSYEKAVDDMTTICIRKMHQFAEDGRLTDVPHWMQYYAFDVIGEITFNKSFGMMEHEADTTGMIPGIRKANDSLAFLGIIPNLLPWVITLTTLIGKQSGSGALNGYALDVISETREMNKQSTVRDSKSYDTFLKKLVDMEAGGRIKMPNVMDACASNIGAGSDTTAITLSAALFYLFTNPQVLKTLREEIDTMAADGRISDPVTFQEAQDMHYLQATIKETLRLHPAVGTILPRVVPEGGIELSSQYFPAGTEVGVNSWVLHYSKDIYGPDAERFRPERWNSAEKTKMMESMMFAFGGGSRTCIGRNISLLEITKVIPQIVRKFDLVLEHPDKPMDTKCAWFVYPAYKGWFKLRGSK